MKPRKLGLLTYNYRCKKFDGKGVIITNVADPEDKTDVITFGYLKEELEKLPINDKIAEISDLLDKQQNEINTLCDRMEDTEKIKQKYNKQNIDMAILEPKIKQKLEDIERQLLKTTTTDKEISVDRNKLEIITKLKDIAIIQNVYIQNIESLVIDQKEQISKLATNKQLNNISEDYNNKIEFLNEEISKLVTIKKINNISEDYNNKINNLNYLIDQINKKISKSLTDIDEVSNDKISKLNILINEQNKKNREIINNLDSRIIEIIRVQNTENRKISNLENQNTKLDERISELEENSVAKIFGDKDVTGLKENIKKLEDKITIHDEQIEKLKLGGTTEGITELIDQNENQDKEINDLKTKISQLDENNKKYDDMLISQKNLITNIRETLDTSLTGTTNLDINNPPVNKKLTEEIQKLKNLFNAHKCYCSIDIDISVKPNLNSDLVFPYVLTSDHLKIKNTIPCNENIETNIINIYYKIELYDENNKVTVLEEIQAPMTIRIKQDDTEIYSLRIETLDKNKLILEKKIPFNPDKFNIESVYPMNFKDVIGPDITDISKICIKLICLVEICYN